MRRLDLQPRPDWPTKVEALGYLFHTKDAQCIWNESAYYSFSQQEIAELERATEALYGLCLDAVDWVVANRQYKRLGIPEWFQPVIEQSWNKRASSLYGRFDLAFDGVNPPKMLEFNAEGGVALLEAALVQRLWRQECFPSAGQFNRIHEVLVARWRELIHHLRNQPLYFLGDKNQVEPHANAEYIRVTAIEAGVDTRPLDWEDLGWDETHLLDSEGQVIQNLFKYYLWEDLLPLSLSGFVHNEEMLIIEPAWKMLLSSKAILAILWELFPNHENLLPAFFSPGPLGDEYVQKPLFSRAGGNVTIHLGQARFSKPGDFGREGFIYQRYCPLFSHNHINAVVGSWVIGGKAAGIGVLEDLSKIMNSRSVFVPHISE